MRKAVRRSKKRASGVNRLRKFAADLDKAVNPMVEDYTETTNEGVVDSTVNDNPTYDDKRDVVNKAARRRRATARRLAKKASAKKRVLTAKAKVAFSIIESLLKSEKRAKKDACIVDLMELSPKTLVSFAKHLGAESIDIPDLNEIREITDDVVDGEAGMVDDVNDLEDEQGADLEDTAKAASRRRAGCGKKAEEDELETLLDAEEAVEADEEMAALSSELGEGDAEEDSEDILDESVLFEAMDEEVVEDEEDADKEGVKASRKAVASIVKRMSLKKASAKKDVDSLSDIWS